jgi:hypothetical protein
MQVGKLIGSTPIQLCSHPLLFFLLLIFILSFIKNSLLTIKSKLDQTSGKGGYMRTFILTTTTIELITSLGVNWLAGCTLT